jgi:hypothetical protein
MRELNQPVATEVVVQPPPMVKAVSSAPPVG